MRTAKMSFSNIKDVLSRDEMRESMAGSGSGGCGSCQDKFGSWACASWPGGCTCPSSEIPGNKCS